MDEEELGSARFEATAFMLNLAGVAALLAYAALTAVLDSSRLPNANNMTIWGLAFGGGCWCLYTARDSLRTLRNIASAAYMDVPRDALRLTAGLSLAVGAALGLVYGLFVEDSVSLLLKNYGRMTVILAGVAVVTPLLWFVAGVGARLFVRRVFFKALY
jgi:hypothetical protein